LSTPHATSDPPLSAATAEALLAQVASVGEVSGHLPAGLRAAADETDSWRLASALRRVAGEVERGRPLDDVIAGATRRLPAHLAGLIRGAQRTGSLGPVLAQWLENRRATRVHWSAVISSLAYPTITLFIAILLYILSAIFIVRPFCEMIVEFGINAPVNIKVLYWLSTTGLNLFFVVSSALAAILVLLRLVGGRVAWSWMLTQLPIIGPTWHWSGAADALRSLGLLVEHRIPLPEALELAGRGASDAYVGRLLGDLSGRITAGTPLFLAILQQRGLPLSVVPLVRWGEQTGLLGESLASAAEMLEGRLRARSLLLVQVLPPLILIVVVLLILSFVSLVFGTMFTVLQGLS
jgi:type II secretory pathway component PulF